MSIQKILKTIKISEKTSIAIDVILSKIRDGIFEDGR